MPTKEPRRSSWSLNHRRRKAAISTATEALFGSTTGEGDDEQRAAPDLRAALKEHPAANIAIISVPGPYAAFDGVKKSPGELAGSVLKALAIVEYLRYPPAWVTRQSRTVV